VCEICVLFDATRTLCPLCFRRARRVQTFARGLMAVVGVAVIGSLAAAVGYVTFREKPFDWGVHAPKVRYLVGELEREPCDQEKIVELGDTLNAAGDFRGALKHAEAFFGKCGPLPRLLWTTYAAHRHLSEHAQAIADATRLIELVPGDKDYWWWRGIVYEDVGRLTEAASDYERSLELQPALGNIPFNLAGVYERLGRPCDALKTIERFVAYHPQMADSDQVVSRSARLRRAGHCAETPGR
jgi:tetratricopeptide (TPR) repeat protein